MNRNTLIVPVALALLALAGCANDKAGHNDHAQHQMQLPPGWSEADMKACMEAGMPGKNHEWLAQSVGSGSLVSAARTSSPSSACFTEVRGSATTGTCSRSPRTHT